MKLDEYGLLIREYWPPGHPGNLGDAYAETARLSMLKIAVGSIDEARELQQNLWRHCVLRQDFGAAEDVIVGFIRHPNCPPEWGGVNDFPTDQFLPGFCCTGWGGKQKMIWFLEQTITRSTTPDGLKPLMPMGWSCVARHQGKQNWWKDLPIYQQVGLFKFVPYRWNDGKKCFEKTEETAADWLNWFMCLVYAETTGSHTWSTKRAAKAVPRAEFMKRIRAHYLEGREPEPNVQWLLALYEQAVVKVLG